LINKPYIGSQLRRAILTSAILFILSRLAFPQGTDYSLVFGEDWKKAEQYVKDNRTWMEPVLKRNHISYPLAIAVIFPELVRYSALRDKMEITLLKALYINLGDQYANFSVGRFQMKPSFAEAIRGQAHTVMPRRSGISFPVITDTTDIREYRKSIIADLEDPESELRYLIVFIKICDRSFRTNRMEEVERLKFLATAYNYGFNKSSEEISRMTGLKFFNTKLFSTETYPYADVSLCWYDHYKSDTIKSTERQTF
jgi:hypothetical protein